MIKGIVLISGLFFSSVGFSGTTDNLDKFTYTESLEYLDILNYDYIFCDTLSNYIYDAGNEYYKTGLITKTVQEFNKSSIKGITTKLDNFAYLMLESVKKLPDTTIEEDQQTYYLNYKFVFLKECFNGADEFRSKEKDGKND